MIWLCGETLRNQAFGLDLGVYVSCLLALPKELVLGNDVSSVFFFFFNSFCIHHFHCELLPNPNPLTFFIFHVHSIFSVISQIGLLFLGVSFFSNSICHNVEKRSDIKLREDDFLRLARLILPATNLAISKMRKLFSGEPSMTLKVGLNEKTQSLNYIN